MTKTNVGKLSEHKVGKVLRLLGIDVTNPKFPDTFVETGTNDGAGVDWALSLPNVFKSVFSCEIWEPTFLDLRVHYGATRKLGYVEVPYKLGGEEDFYVKTIKGLRNSGAYLVINLMDSRVWLPWVLESIHTTKKPNLVWLDAHPGSGVPSSLGLPLQEELAALKQYSNSGDVVIIDDVSLFGTDVDGGCYKDTTREYVLKELKEIYPEHEIISTLGMDEFFHEKFGYDDYFVAIPRSLKNVTED